MAHEGDKVDAGEGSVVRSKVAEKGQERERMCRHRVLCHLQAPAIAVKEMEMDWG